MLERRAPRALLIALTVLVLAYIVPLGVRPLLVPDEFRYAEIPREMLASGDWIVPHLDGMPYFEKPILGYWITAAGLRILGTSAFALRLPCVLAVFLSAWLLHRLTRRRPGFLAGVAPLVLLSSALVYGVGVTLVLDSFLAAWLTLTLVASFAATEEPVRAKRRALVALAGLACGLAFLTKGFLGPVVPALVLVPYLAWRGIWRTVIADAWIALVAFLAVALPWSIAVHLADGDFWRVFFWKEHVRRFASADAEHSRPIWFYLPVVLAAALPWSFQLPALVRGLRTGIRDDPLVRFSCLWALVPFLFFSLAHGKLPTYLLPIFPALALVIASGLGIQLARGETKAFDAAARVGGALVLVAGSVVALVWLTGIAPELYRPSEGTKVAGALAASLAWAVCSWSSASARPPRTKLALYALSPLGPMLFFALGMPASFLEVKAPGAFLAAHAERIGADALLVTDEKTVHPVCWTLGRNDVYVMERMGELEYGLGREEGAGRFLDAAGLQRLIAEAGGERPIFVIHRDRANDTHGDFSSDVVFEARWGSFDFAELRRVRTGFAPAGGPRVRGVPEHQTRETSSR